MQQKKQVSKYCNNELFFNFPFFRSNNPGIIILFFSNFIRNYYFLNSIN